MNFGLLLTLLLIISSCSIKGYKPIAESGKYKITVPYVFANNFEKVLYKTTIEIYNNNITGLTLIKKTDSAYRVVSMSELGMKYFDFEFPLDEQIPAIVHYVMEPLNKKMLVNMITHDFNLIFHLPMIDKSNILISNNDSSNMTAKHNKFYYFFNSLGTISKITKQQSSKPMVSLSDYTQYYPNIIMINHGKIKFKYEGIDK